MPNLPLEIQALIIHFLQDFSAFNFRGYSTSLTICALVCRAWVSPSRTALFRRFVLDDCSAQDFLHLFDTHLETFSSARISQFDYQQDEVRRREYLEDPDSPCHTFNDVLKWRSSDGKRDLSTLLAGVERMELGYLGWDTLDRGGRRRLAECFSSVKHLKLYGTQFPNPPTFHTFLHSFPHLSAVHLDDVVVTTAKRDQEPSDSHEDAPSRLRTIVLENFSLRDGTNTIESLIPCPSLQSFSYSYYFDVKALKASRSTVLNRLLASAGDSLEDFSVTVWREVVEDRVGNTFRNIDLSQNPNLRRINLSIHDSSNLITFLENLSSTRTIYSTDEPHLHHLRIERLPQVDLDDWTRLDDVLQHPYFSALREIVYEANREEEVEEVRRHLPQCERRGILEYEKAGWLFEYQLSSVDGLKELD
ncbi:hypothetical protein PM082_019393 [Marasmius tenuissimus]|nr:hypothetical protein PM082_019393 [Marasmius tenuissimus]